MVVPGMCRASVLAQAEHPDIEPVVGDIDAKRIEEGGRYARGVSSEYYAAARCGI
jgi:hypothetical protein